MQPEQNGKSISKKAPQLGCHLSFSGLIHCISFDVIHSLRLVFFEGCKQSSGFRNSFSSFHPVRGRPRWPVMRALFGRVWQSAARDSLLVARQSAIKRRGRLEWGTAPDEDGPPAEEGISEVCHFSTSPINTRYPRPLLPETSPAAEKRTPKAGRILTHSWMRPSGHIT